MEGRGGYGERKGVGVGGSELRVSNGHPRQREKRQWKRPAKLQFASDRKEKKNNPGIPAIEGRHFLEPQIKQRLWATEFSIG